MNLLKDILFGVRIDKIIGSTNVAIEHITFDSRDVVSFSCFVAIKGTQVDGHKYIQTAINQKASVIICEDLPKQLVENITYVKVKNSSEALGIIAANFYDNPSDEIKLVGVTGTNGKTTTVTLLYNLFRKLGYKTGLLSTVVNKVNNKVIDATHTTPNAVALNRLLRQMVDEGCEFAFMEVSSHAIDQNRIAGVNFTGGVFTNITRDHLDYHNTFNEYIHAKKKFFDNLPENAFALVNKDDKHGATMFEHTSAKKLTFALKSFADFKGKIIENTFEGLELNINNKEVWTKLVGSFNAYNILSVYAVAQLLEQDEMETLTALSSLENVSGRFEYFISDKKITAIVDYAHTPDALQNVLSTINDIRTGNEKLITVVGCGGDRDKGKRPLMGAIAADKSNKAVFTSDNPRTEDPSSIIQEIQKGVDPSNFKKTISITDRREAIKLACMEADSGDIILVAGKGHETYQEINGERFDFDDKLIVSETLKMLDK